MLHHPPSAGESSPHGGALFHGGAPPEHTAEDETELARVWQPTALPPRPANNSSFAPLHLLPRRSSSTAEPGMRSSDRTALKDSDSGTEPNQIPPMYDGPFCAAPTRRASRAFGLSASFGVVGALVVGALAVLGPRKPKMVTSLCNNGNVADFCHSFCHSTANAPTLTITGFSALDLVVLTARANDCCQERIVAAMITYSLAAKMAWSPTSAAAAVGARLSDNLNHTKSGEFVCMAQWPLHDSFLCCCSFAVAPRPMP
jgi:hypothetical protein